jgi:hypothetical protein
VVRIEDYKLPKCILDSKPIGRRDVEEVEREFSWNRPKVLIIIL